MICHPTSLVWPSAVQAGRLSANYGATVDANKIARVPVRSSKALTVMDDARSNRAAGSNPRKAGTRSSPARSGQQFIPPPLCPAICPRVVLTKLMVPRRMNTLTRYASNVSLINNHVLRRLMVPTASRAGGTRCLRTRCGGTCRLRQARYTCGNAATNRQSDLWLHVTINGSQSCEPPNTFTGGLPQGASGYRRSPAQFGRRGDWARTVVHCLPPRWRQDGKRGHGNDVTQSAPARSHSRRPPTVRQTKTRGNETVSGLRAGDIKKDGVMPGTTRKPPSSVLAKDTRRLKATSLGVSSGYHPGNRHMAFTTPCVNRHQNEE